MLAGSDFSAASYCLTASSILPEPGVCGAEIRQRVSAIGRDRERRLVGFNRAEQIAGLVQLHGAREQPLEIRSVGAVWPPACRRQDLRRRRTAADKQENQQEENPATFTVIRL